MVNKKRSMPNGYAGRRTDIWTTCSRRATASMAPKATPLPITLRVVVQRLWLDILTAVSKNRLQTLDSVDPNRIGVLGICASGWYVPFTAQTDERMKAVATVSGIDLGTLNSEGFGSFNGPMLPNIRTQLAEANRQHLAEARGVPPNLTRIFPNTAADVMPQLPVFYQKSYDYYQTPRGHVNAAPNWHLWRSLEMLATYRSYTYMDLISPRPLLMIAGSDADTLYMSQRAIDIAEEPNELFLVLGMIHTDLYDHNDLSLPKLLEFFTIHL
ncbi:hypothetical protein TruAng_002496 [Truncatella angustata]|nr:hypothetical protein TruAng_002496 [Truncatella angustata]